MSRNRRTIIHFPVFGAEVRVIFAKNVYATGKRIHAKADPADIALTFCDTAKPDRVHIVFPLDPDEGVIAHESVHAIKYLFSLHGVTGNEELFAYHLDYLVGQIHKCLSRQ